MPSDLQVSNIKALDGTDGISIADSTGNTTLSGNLVIPDDGTIGSASDTDAITIDTSGNVLVGKTATGISTAGHSYRADGTWEVRRDLGTAGSSSVGYLSRGTTDGPILTFYKDTTNVGAIGSNGTNIFVSFRQEAHGDGCGLVGSGSQSGALIPTDGDGDAINNHINLGSSSNSFNDVFTHDGNTTTSDRNEKQDIKELSEVEKRVAIACKGLLKKFRWKSAVDKKGDNARIHFGIIAQDLKSAFEAEGLDAGRYGMFVHSEWWETEETYTNDDGVEKTRTNIYETEEEAPSGAVKKDRMGVRYSELLAFIISAI